MFMIFLILGKEKTSLDYCPGLEIGLELIFCKKIRVTIFIVTL